MKEKEIRERIAQFLKRTARTVVVPASMGLGLSACDGHGLRGKTADAGVDVMAQNADAATNAPDLPGAANEDGDLAKSDLPLIAVPYLIVMAPDAAPDMAADVLEAQSVDADRDVLSSPLDVRAEIPYPPPPYLMPPMLPDASPDGDYSPPFPPYLLPAMEPDKQLGSARETPPLPDPPAEKK